MKHVFIVVFGALIIAFPAIAKREHNHKKDDKWHCEKNVDGKPID